MRGDSTRRAGAVRAGINAGLAKRDRARGRKRPPPWQTTGGRAVLLAIALAGAGVVAALLGGGEIGDGGAPEPRPVSGAPKQVTDTILAFERALGEGDFEAICSTLFTVEAREAAGGDRCPSVLQDTAGDVKRPDVRIVSVSIQGNNATAIVRASSQGSPPVTDTIRLTRQGGRYRIVSAGQPASVK